MERFKAYKFFAHLFSYPEGVSFFEKLEEFYPFEDKKPLEDLKAIPLEELQAEYTSLFIANYGGVPCKPYQSFFTAEKTLMGAPALDTQKFFDLFGLTVPEGELPDKVSFQLDFAAFLLKLKEETPYLEDKKKIDLLFKEFFKKHILWMESFADCVEKNSSLKPLKVFAERFKEFLEGERKLLRL